MSSEISIKDEKIKIVPVALAETSSGDEQPMSEWSSLEEEYYAEIERRKKSYNEKGLYFLGSGDICNDYVSMSDSTIPNHPYYNYPAVTDPGIKEALLELESPIIYPDDGQKLYLQICSEMNICPVRMFYRNLLSPLNSVSYYGVNPRGVRAMAIALQNNRTVTCFNMTDNFLNDDACYHLGQMLKSNTTLKELILDGCHIGRSGLLQLGEYLYLNRTLESLNLASNNFGDNCGVVLAKQIYTGFNVKKLNLSKNNLGRETAIALVEALEWQNSFTHLDLSWNSFIHVPSTVKMIGQLASSELLQELNLSFNSLEGDRVAGAIYNIFNVPTLKVLDLSHNQFSGESINIIIPGLINAKNLRTFNLSYNPMTPEDAYNTLQKMLLPRVKLQQLLLENISVNKSFLILLDRVSKMKSRKNFSILHGYVLQNWTIEAPDQRELLLKRADYLGKSLMRNPIDIALYFLRLNKEYPKSVSLKVLIERFENDKIPLTEVFINELSFAFAGPALKRSRTVDFNLIAEFIARLWPDKKLSPTPPLEPESVSVEFLPRVESLPKAKSKM